MHAVGASDPISSSQTTRVSNEQQWLGVVEIAVAEFHERFADAQVTDVKLKSRNGENRAFRSSWVPEFRIEGVRSDGHGVTLQGVIESVVAGQPVEGLRVASAVEHVTPKLQSGSCADFFW